MTTLTVDCDESGKTTAIAAEVPTVSDAPGLVAHGNALEPAAIAESVSATTAEAPKPDNNTVLAETAASLEAFEAAILDASTSGAGIPEPVIPETTIQVAPVPATVVPPAVVAEAAPAAPQVSPVAQPIHRPAAARSMPPLAPPFLREHERRVTAGRPRPAAEPGKNASAPPPPAPKASSRFPLLAATLALAACLGAAAGAVGVSALIKAAPVHAAAAGPTGTPTAELNGLKAMVAQQAADLGALKASLEQSAKATAAQYGKITERLAQAEPTAKLAKIVEALERLEKRPVPAAADITGSVHPASPQPHAEAKPKPVILEDYVLRRVFDGVALVEGRRGIIEVEPGATLPGAGRVEEIRRQDGRWVVVTQKGLIVPPR